MAWQHQQRQQPLRPHRQQLPRRQRQLRCYLQHCRQLAQGSRLPRQLHQHQRRLLLLHQQPLQLQGLRLLLPLQLLPRRYPLRLVSLP